jgi:hypothetical protein
MRQIFYVIYEYAISFRARKNFDGIGRNLLCYIQGDRADHNQYQ